MIQAIDPEGCACTDCLTGYSLPLDSVSVEQVQAAMMGELEDRTSSRIEVSHSIVVRWGGREWGWKV